MTTEITTTTSTAKSKMMEWGGEYRSLAEMQSFVVPAATKTYNPPHPLKVHDEVCDRVETLQGLTLTDSGFVVNKKGTQWMLLALFEGDNSLDNLGAQRSILARGSTDKMHSLLIESGVALKACFNGLSWGDKDVTLRNRASAKGFDNLVDSLTGALYRMERDRSRGTIVQISERLQATPVEQAEGYKLLGYARGCNVLSPRQFETALGDWNTPRHECFAERNAFNLFQCVNQALKQGQPASYPTRISEASEWYASEVFPERGTIIDVVA